MEVYPSSREPDTPKEMDNIVVPPQLPVYHHVYSDQTTNPTEKHQQQSEVMVRETKPPLHERLKHDQ